MGWFPVGTDNCLGYSFKKRVLLLQEVEKQKSNTKLAEQQLVHQQQVLQQEKVRLPDFRTLSLGEGHANSYKLAYYQVNLSDLPKL